MVKSKQHYYTSLNRFGLRTARILAVGGFIVLIIMAIWIIIDVFSGIFGWGLPGMVDWVEVLNVVCIALPLAYVTFQGRHISMSIIHEHMSHKGKYVFDLIILIGMFLYSAMMAWRLSVEAWYSLQMWERNDVGIVVYWFPAKIILAFGFIMMTFIIIIQLIGVFGKKRGGNGAQR